MSNNEQKDNGLNFKAKTYLAEETFHQPLIDQIYSTRNTAENDKVLNTIKTTTPIEFKKYGGQISDFNDYMSTNNVLSPTVTKDNSTKDYKYNEDKFLALLHEHVDKTYSSHYGGNIQPVEFVMSNAESLDYLKGNVVKYIYRFGKKNGSDKNDLLKACHFIMMMARYGNEKK